MCKQGVGWGGGGWGWTECDIEDLIWIIQFVCESAGFASWSGRRRWGESGAWGGPGWGRPRPPIRTDSSETCASAPYPFLRPGRKRWLGPRSRRWPRTRPPRPRGGRRGVAGAATRWRGGRATAITASKCSETWNDGTEIGMSSPFRIVSSRRWEMNQSAVGMMRSSVIIVDVSA